MMQKRYADAARLYEQALAKANGKDSDLIVKRHLAQLKSGDAKSADATLLDWVKAHPQDLKVRSYLGRSYAMRGLRSQAIEQYRIVSNAVPNDAAVLNNLAVLYQEAGDARALPTAEQAYKLDPERPAHADTLGWILLQQGKTERGIQLLNKAAAGAPKNPEIRYHYAYALAKAGQKSLAQKEVDALRKMKLPPTLQQQVEQLSRSL
jgi:Flp pilus assembly protein TadD